MGAGIPQPHPPMSEEFIEHAGRYAPEGSENPIESALKRIFDELTLLSMRLDEIRPDLSDEPGILNEEEMYRYLNVGPKSLDRLIKNDNLPAYKRGGKRYFKRTEVDEWATRNRELTPKFKEAILNEQVRQYLASHPEPDYFSKPKSTVKRPSRPLTEEEQEAKEQESKRLLAEANAEAMRLVAAERAKRAKEKAEKDQ